MRFNDLSRYDQVVLYGMGVNGRYIFSKIREFFKGELLLFDRKPGEIDSYPIYTPDFSLAKGNHIVVITPTITGFVREMYNNIPSELNVITLFNIEDYIDSGFCEDGEIIGTGLCPQCENTTRYISQISNMELKGLGFVAVRNSLCDNCGAILRERSTIDALNTFFPNWKKGVVHESSPVKLRITNMLKLFEGQPGEYSYSYFYPNVPLGKISGGGAERCENLEKLTFDDESVDFIITTDVFEHINNPIAAFASISRVIKPGGAHIFTVPYNRSSETAFRVKARGDELIYLDKPVYHGNPISSDGSLVTVDWGYDIGKYIHEATDGKMMTLAYDNYSSEIGNKYAEIEGQRRLFISVKAARNT